MPFKLHAAMASRLRDEIKPRRFDLTMSRRTRRPGPAATSATGCHEQDHHEAVDVERLGFQLMVVQPERHDPDGLFCLSDHLQSRQPEPDAHQEHETLEQRSEDTTKEQQPSPPRTCRLQKKDGESEAQQNQQDDEECQDNSHRFSLQELIEDEAVDGGVKGAATGGTEGNAAAAVVEDAEGAAAAGEAKRSDQVAGRKVIGIMRRYVKVRSIKPRRASPEKNATLVC